MSQYVTFDEAAYGADKAIDMDLSTRSLAQPVGNVNAWFRASLDKEHCIKQVVHYFSSQDANTHTCSKDTCTCEGGLCHIWTLRVYHQTTVFGDNPPSGCKLGDTVEITGDVYLLVYEIVITTPIGSLLNSLTLSNYSKYFPEPYPTMN